MDEKQFTTIFNFTPLFSEFFQGIKSPIERKSTDFDAIASSSVAQMHAPAMKHFFAYIMQFQILKALCGNATNLVKLIC